MFESKTKEITMAQKKNLKEISYILNDDDLIAFNQYYILNSKFGKRLIWRQRLIFPAFLVIFLAIMYACKSEHRIVVGGTVLLGTISVFMFFYAKRLVLNQQVKAVRNSANDLSRIHANETIIRFGDDEFEAVNSEGDNFFKYSEVKKLSLTEDGIYVWMSERMAIPISRSAFNRPGDMEELFDFLVNKCTNAEK